MLMEHITILLCLFISFKKWLLSYRALGQCGFQKDGSLTPDPEDSQYILSLPTRHIWEITPDLRTAIVEAGKFCQMVS